MAYGLVNNHQFFLYIQGLCKVGRGRLKPLQSQAFTQNNRQVSESKRRERLRQLPEAALRRLEYSLRRQAWGIGCCDLSRPAACQATLHTPWVTTQVVIASAVREAIPDERIGDCFAAARLAMTGGLSSYKFAD